MNSFWKIRHKETGLFYRPVSGYRKNNLSKRGKVYQSKPSLQHIRHGYYRLIDKQSTFIRMSSNSVSEVFEIVVFKVEAA